MIGFLLVLALLGLLFARVPVIRLYERRSKALQHRLEQVRRSPHYRRHIQGKLHGIGLAILPDERTDQ